MPYVHVSSIPLQGQPLLKNRRCLRCDNSQGILFEILAETQPDGRPLWAYGLDYARLATWRHSLLTMPVSELTGWDIRLLIPCLSETLRREHGGGAWSWHTASEMRHVSVPLRERCDVRKFWRVSSGNSGGWTYADRLDLGQVGFGVGC